MKSDPRPEDRAAGNGLIHRRAVLRGGLGAAATGAFLQALAPGAARAQGGAPAAAAASAVVNPWQRVPGGPMSEYGERSRYEKDVHRTIVQLYKAVAPQVGWCGTPLEALHGIITPSGLHHERHHSGVPDIDPDKHELMIHGLVKKPLVFSMASLARYPTVSRIQFLECSGNSYYMLEKEPMQVTCGQIHGSVSCSEWTGIPLRTLLEEAGIDKKAKWAVADGADSANMARSIPLEKLLDDSMIALFQNGEALRPEQGYPVRLFVPGWEGNTHIKWLSRIKLTETPAHSREETMKYTDLMPDGRAMQFSMEMGVKSVITNPSGNMTLPARGLYELTGLAWSGSGKIKRVDVSADGGKTWAKASLYGQELQHSLVRFRLPWQWDGQPALLESRATDEKGRTQETRQKHVAKYSMKNMYHYNAIQTWAVDTEGKVRNVY